MDARQLFKQKGSGEFSPVGLWVCAKCRRIAQTWSGGSYISTAAAAEECCRPAVCANCSTTENMSPHYSECQPCRDRRESRADAELQAKRMASADEVLGYTGWVWCRETQNGRANGYHESIRDLQEYYFEREDELPEFVFACTEEVLSLDINHAIGCLSDDAYEDMDSHLSDPGPELVAAVDAWNKENAKALTQYHIDYSRKVRVPPIPAA